jgi:hypothetical protein
MGLGGGERVGEAMSGLWGIIGILVGSLLTYFVQMKTSEKQHKWSVEENEARFQKEIESEKRKRNEELVYSRLKPIEEAILIMSCDLSYSFDQEIGEGSSVNFAIIESGREKLDIIYPTVWDSIQLLGDNSIKENWKKFAHTYWSMRREGDFHSLDFQIEVEEPRITIQKSIDKIKINLAYPNTD